MAEPTARRSPIAVARPPNRAPRITSSAGDGGRATQAYAYTVTATDADGDPLTFTLTRRRRA